MNNVPLERARVHAGRSVLALLMVVMYSGCGTASAQTGEKRPPPTAKIEAALERKMEPWDNNAMFLVDLEPDPDGMKAEPVPFRSNL